MNTSACRRPFAGAIMPEGLVAPAAPRVKARGLQVVSQLQSLSTPSRGQTLDVNPYRSRHSQTSRGGAGVVLECAAGEPSLLRRPRTARGVHRQVATADPCNGLAGCSMGRRARRVRFSCRGAGQGAAESHPRRRRRRLLDIESCHGSPCEDRR